jgi:hypothetical protein
MKNSVFWDVMPCSPLKVNWCFRRTCHLHIEGQRGSQSRNQLEADGKQSHLPAYAGFLISLLFGCDYHITQQHIPENIVPLNPRINQNILKIYMGAVDLSTMLSKFNSGIIDVGSKNLSIKQNKTFNQRTLNKGCTVYHRAVVFNLEYAKTS